MIRIGSLFSGIGGLDLGVEWATGGRVVWHCEVDDHARKVLAKHWPGVPCYPDVRNIGEGLEHVDIICGGFPCQDISQAGKRAGIRGERSGLWSEFARIIRDVRPGVVFVENVAALVTRGLDVVLGDLADLGLDAEWFRLGAYEVGAPHIRQRIFVLAASRPLPDAVGDAIREQREREGEQHDESGADESADDGGAEHVADADGGRRSSGGVTERHHEQREARSEFDRRCSRRSARRDTAREGWPVEPDVGRMVDGSPRPMDRRRLECLGRAVVPQQAYAAFLHLAGRMM